MDAARRAELRRRDQEAAAGRTRRTPSPWTAEDFGCGDCGDPLPKNPPRRHVPRRGGRLLPVCKPCADAIDDQTTLLARAINQVDRAVDRHLRATGRLPERPDILGLLSEAA